MSNLLILGAPNLTAEAYTTVSTTGFAGLSPVGMEPSYLKTEEPTDIARLTLLDPKHTQFLIDFAGLDSIISAFAPVNHNIAPGGRVRLIGWFNAATPWVYQVQAPNAIAASTNITGGVTNVDEAIDTPDGLVITPTAPTSLWLARFSFASLSFTPDTREDMGAFVLRARLNATGAGATAPISYPKLTVDLWENGTLKKTLGYRAVTRSTAGGQVLIFPFSFSDLTAPSGVNLEVTVTCTVGASVSGSQFISLEALALYYEKDPSIAGLTLQDSGWFDVLGKVPKAPSANFHAMWTSQPWTGIQSVVLVIQTDQAAHDGMVRTQDDTVPVGAISAPDSFVQVGTLPLGLAKVLDDGVRKHGGPKARPVSTPLGSSTAGGQTYGADAYRRREMRGLDLRVSRDELAWLQYEIAYKKGETGAVYVAMEPDVELGYQVFTAFWGTADIGEPVADGKYKPGGGMKFALSASFIEKL